MYNGCFYTEYLLSVVTGPLAGALRRAAYWYRQPTGEQRLRVGAAWLEQLGQDGLKAMQVSILGQNLQRRSAVLLLSRHPQLSAALVGDRMCSLYCCGLSVLELNEHLIVVQGALSGQPPFSWRK